jgi:hypothetical protein
MSEIERLMLEIIHLEEPKVFRVELTRNDHFTRWSAYATLRANDKNYACDSDTPEKALEYLLAVLRNTICPHCGQFRDGEK